MIGASTHITAALTLVEFWLFFKSCHCLFVGPAWASEIVVVLVTVFLQPAPHMAVGLVTPESSIPHFDHPYGCGHDPRGYDHFAFLLLWLSVIWNSDASAQSIIA